MGRRSPGPPIYMTTAISELTGQPVDTSSEQWRAETEARALLAMRDRNARNRFLGMVAKLRGQPAADELKRRAEDLFYTRRNGRPQAVDPAQRDLLSA